MGVRMDSLVGHMVDTKVMMMVVMFVEIWSCMVLIT